MANRFCSCCCNIIVIEVVIWFYLLTCPCPFITPEVLGKYSHMWKLLHMGLWHVETRLQKRPSFHDYDFVNIRRWERNFSDQYLYRVFCGCNFGVSFIAFNAISLSPEICEQLKDRNALSHFFTFFLFFENQYCGLAQYILLRYNVLNMQSHIYKHLYTNKLST